MTVFPKRKGEKEMKGVKLITFAVRLITLQDKTWGWWKSILFPWIDLDSRRLFLRQATNRAQSSEAVGGHCWNSDKCLGSRKGREIQRKTCSLECFLWKNEKWQKADGGMTTLFVLYWMINMCYTDMGPQGGHGAADAEGSTLHWNSPAFKLAS